MSPYITFERLFARLGGRHLILVIGLVQVIAFFGAVPGIVSIRVNTASAGLPLGFLSILAPALIVVTFLTLLLVGMRLTTAARKRLDEISSKQSSIMPPKDEITAWREMTSLTVRYGIASVVIAFVLNVIPTTAAILISENTSRAAAPGPGNTLFALLGGIAAVLGYAVLATFLLGRFTLPFRLLLAPENFEDQVKGRAGVLVLSKFLILVFAVIIISILILAPIGYQQVTRVLFTDATPMEIFQDLQTNTIAFSVLVLALGIAIAYFASRSISDPVTDLLKTFDLIERGDLSARAPISATDELGIVTIHFNRMVARLESLQSYLEQQVTERTKQLSATNEIGRVAASSLDPAEMLSSIVNLFTEKFGYYFVGVYLLDSSDKWAELKEASGEAGKLLIKSRHRADVSGSNLVGLAIRDRAAKSYPHTTGEKYRANLPVLPYTRSELALPLIASDRVIGALNLHSVRETDFGAEAINTLQNMANQVAIALENARLFQGAQQNIRELRAIQKQYLFTGWSGIASHPEELEYGVGDESEEKARQMEIPISLRDQILGQIRLESPDEWTAEDESLVSAVATQAAVALENARLVSESRQIALRERMLSEINSKIWASTTVEGVMQTVVKELGRRYDASRATIELTLDEAE
ncbi:MAG TPA: GAF domain-containing protein [Anaerolineales bacterium]|jgi:GAF domain-containing protein/HAMP domain-containing protein|nr:GAF domain-containing protein [Anaerolineales bacterium]HQX16679.1 GAF domain-containing protein [Anaerolineales bacterium]